jgi:hypothetical protein
VGFPIRYVGALNDADVSAFIRYIEKLKTHNTENAK